MGARKPNSPSLSRFLSPPPSEAHSAIEDLFIFIQVGNHVVLEPRYSLEDHFLASFEPVERS